MKENKKIGKLLELLNEYEQEECCWRLKYGKLHNKYYDDYDQKDEEIRLISKWYGFIKWLVENDKIDIVKVYENLTNYEIEIRIRAVKELLENNEEDTIAYLKLLMLLAIQDEPIRFLCEIIK